MRTRGVSAVEIMIAVMVCAAITVPMLGLLFQERDTEQRSRFEYVALLAARDEMYQAKFLVGIGAQPASVAHADARPLKGSPMQGIPGTVFTDPGGLPDYSADQERVKLVTEIDAAPADVPRLHAARTTAAWLDPELAKIPSQQGRKTTVELQFGVLRPPWVPVP